MAHGTPDWGVTSGAQTIFQVADLGEAVARLGALSVFDRGGDVVFQDDFSGGLAAWSSVLFGLGAAVQLTAAEVRSGLLAAKLTGGSDSYRWGGIVHVEGPQENARIGIECFFHPDAAIGSFEIWLQVYDGTTMTQYRLVYDDANNRLQYVDGTDTLTTFATPVSLGTAGVLFHGAKLVIDADAGEYLRFRLNKDVYSLAGAAAYSSADSNAPQFYVLLLCTSRSGQNDSVIVDSVIITQNEPA